MELGGNAGIIVVDREFVGVASLIHCQFDAHIKPVVMLDCFADQVT
ncbi:hypothetical protein ACPOL_4758 [Acidisarcina polymorpha]|uniref:Uncharacterized protein n=1 Tax=Acidisarcina polymorpha TaxID=2211140 RepID=A0A2Z5G5J4_9BACT|nr:hypothetical protein ACPOL_4758 [Acidisarcina polymorpha]